MGAKVTFTKKDKGPLAEAAIWFDADSGPLSGFEIVGIAIWKGKEGKLNATLPSRSYQGKDGKTQYFDYLRLAQDSPAESKWALKNWIIREYEKWSGNPDADF